MISAALGGYLDLLLQLQKYSDPKLYVKLPAEEEGAQDDDEYEVVDKTEL